MRVCYCEDEVAQAELFKKMVDKWSADNGTSVCMDIYESAEEFLFKTDAATYQNKLLYMQKCIIPRQIITSDKYKATNIQENIYL